MARSLGADVRPGSMGKEISSVLGRQSRNPVPEMHEDFFERWLIGHACEISALGSLTPSDLRSDACQYGRAGRQAGECLLREWLNGVAAASA